MTSKELEKLVKSDIEKGVVDAHYSDFKASSDKPTKNSKKGQSKNSK